MKKYFRFACVIPIALFFFASFMDLSAARTGSTTIDGTTLLDLELFAVGSIFSPIITYLLFSIIGFAFIVSENEDKQLLGKALFSIAALSSFLIYRVAGISFGFISISAARPEFVMAFGAYLLLVSALLSLSFMALFLIVPLITSILSKIYGAPSPYRSSASKGKNIFKELEELKKLFDSQVVSLSEYTELKERTLNLLDLTRGNDLQNLNLLKRLELADLITNDDFTDKKKNIFKNTPSVS